MSLAAPEREERARRAVRVAAWVALVAALGGTALALAGARLVPVSGLVAAAGATAIGCLAHCRRHEHERGRAAARAALFVAALALSCIGWSQRFDL